MKDAEIVTAYELASQELYRKKKIVLAVNGEFHIRKVGSKCGDDPIETFSTIQELTEYFRANT